MLGDLLALLWAPFLMCLVLTGIHAYLGVHVLAREVVFVDIALAQIAALGATAAFLVGHETDTWESYACGITATVIGAFVLALTRSRRRHVSQKMQPEVWPAGGNFDFRRFRRHHQRPRVAIDERGRETDSKNIHAVRLPERTRRFEKQRVAEGNQISGVGAAGRGSR